MPLREMAKSYSFRRTRKLSVKAAENGEVPGLRTAKVTRRTSLTEEGEGEEANLEREREENTWKDGKL